jgi:N-acetylmuramic acid 6-phosphate etherase
VAATARARGARWVVWSSCADRGEGGLALNDRDLFETLRRLTTEQRNPATAAIDLAGTAEILELLHAQDRTVLDRVHAALPALVPVVDRIAAAFRGGGRLVYAGAGTSGRLGVLDAAECPPTYGTSPEQVVGLIAGGAETLIRSREGVEDRSEEGRADVDRIGAGAQDVVVGISASRRTPYVRGALERARERGAWTAFLVCNALDEGPSGIADHVVEVVVGPEAITGSTRMKAALAQKMMLTMISTASMIRAGKVYENLMVDVAPTSAKLKERAKGLVMLLTGCDYEAAATALAACDREVKTAVLVVRDGVTPKAARERLDAADGFLRRVLQAPPDVPGSDPASPGSAGP